MSIIEAIHHCEEVAKNACDECAEEHTKLAGWLKELLAYRSDEETGMTKRLPLKVGDTVWIIEYNKEVAPYTVSFISMSEGRETLYFNSRTDKDWRGHYNEHDFFENEIGKYAFLTREAAEAALQKDGAT